MTESTVEQRERITGQILRVWEEEIGTTLTAAAAVSDTVLEVDDCSPFNAAGGWLRVGTQVVEYLSADDDASTITLASEVTTLVDEDEDVAVWSELYGEVSTVQYAHVVVDGTDSNVDPIEAVVADTITDLANGDRGRRAESCVIERDGDEWELIRVGGRPSRARGRRYEADDTYVLTADDVTNGTATFPLTHVPVAESLKAWLGVMGQRPTNYSIDYAAPSVTWPLDGWEKAGDRIWVHYAYLRNAREQGVWRSYATTLSDAVDRSHPDLVDVGWATAELPLSDEALAHPLQPTWPVPAAGFPVDSVIWLRQRIVREPGVTLTLTIRFDDGIDVYWNGESVYSDAENGAATEDTVDVTSTGSDLLAIRAVDGSDVSGPDRSYIGVEID